jgi:hypothetical protein
MLIFRQNLYPPLENLTTCIKYYTLFSRCLVGSTDQACSSGFFFRIAWKSMEQSCFLQNHSLSFLQGLRSLKNWLLLKLSMKSLDQKFYFLIEKWIFWCPSISRNLSLWTLKIQFQNFMTQKNFNFIYCKNYSSFND